MTEPRAGCVYKYFDLADRFIQLNRLDPRTAEQRFDPSLSRLEYRRALIGACCDDLAEDTGARIEALCPEDPLAAEDLLYQLCVSVNPELDIHRVSLRRREESGERPRVRTRARRARSSDPWARLRRSACGLEQRLRKRIFGQDEAIDAVVRMVRKAAAGLAEEERPLATMLFAGRTGTGKTEVARSLARELYGADRGFVRLDCSEFALAHEASKLIGAPPGYVGHEEGGQLTDALTRDPECVVLFDEIEKAHPRMHQLLLQVLEDGRLTDNKGRVVRFDRAFVLLTTNAGATDVVAASRAMGFRAGGAGHAAPTAATIEEITGRALGTCFSPEFLGRIDETIVFRDLEQHDVRSIARLRLTELAARARNRGGRVSFTPAVAQWIADHGFCPDSGARELRRVIRREVEQHVAEWMLEPDDVRSPWLRVSVRRGELVFQPAA